MKKEFVGSGKTIEEARSNALAGLNAPESADVTIEVIQMPKAKVLGLFGGQDAKVAASYDDGKKEPAPVKEKKAPAKKVQEQKKPAKSKAKEEKKVAPKKVTENTTDNKEDKPKRENAKSVDIEAAEKYLYTILESFKVKDAKITSEYKDGVLSMNIDCAEDDHGIIIGNRGETLDSLQYLTGLVVKRNADGYSKVNILIGDYKERRADILKHLAEKEARYVLRSGKRANFEHMNPYERRIIHTTVQDIEGVESFSVGTGSTRHVVLEPTGGVKQTARRDNSSRNNTKAQKADFTQAQFGKIEVEGAKVETPAEAPTPKPSKADRPKFGQLNVTPVTKTEDADETAE